MPPEVTSAFLDIATAPGERSEECTRIIETFVVLLYARGSQLKSVCQRTTTIVLYTFPWFG